MSDTNSGKVVDIATKQFQRTFPSGTHVIIERAANPMLTDDTLIVHDEQGVRWTCSSMPIDELGTGYTMDRPLTFYRWGK